MLHKNDSFDGPFFVGQVREHELVKLYEVLRALGTLNHVDVRHNRRNADRGEGLDCAACPGRFTGQSLPRVELKRECCDEIKKS